MSQDRPQEVSIIFGRETRPASLVRWNDCHSSPHTIVSKTLQMGQLFSCVLPMSKRELLKAGVTETAFTPVGTGQVVGFGELRFGDRRDDHLCYPVASAHSERVFAQVDQYDTYFAPVIGINRARRIEKCHPVVESQPASRSYLRLEPWGYCHVHPGGYVDPLSGRHDRFDGRQQVHTRCTVAHVGGKRQIARVICLLDLDTDGFHYSSNPL